MDWKGDFYFGLERLQEWKVAQKCTGTRSQFFKLALLFGGSPLKWRIALGHQGKGEKAESQGIPGRAQRGRGTPLCGEWASAAGKRCQSEEREGVETARGWRGDKWGLSMDCLSISHTLSHVRSLKGNWSWRMERCDSQCERAWDMKRQSRGISCSFLAGWSDSVRK